MSNELQRTNEWYLARKGHISASQIAVLLGNHKEQMTEEEIAAARLLNPKSRVTSKEVPFSQGTFTYLDGKIAEYYMTDEAYLEYLEQFSYENKAMQWGTFWEGKAREEYCLATEYNVSDAPFIELKNYEKIAGGSPDGIIDDVTGIIEIKCPANPAIHLRHVLYEKPEDLKEDNLDYYAQCQYNMICVSMWKGVQYDFCDFISYDPRTTANKQLKILRIPADKDMQAELIIRTSLAKQYYKEQMEKIDNISTKILSYGE